MRVLIKDEAVEQRKLCGWRDTFWKWYSARIASISQVGRECARRLGVRNDGTIR